MSEEREAVGVRELTWEVAVGSGKAGQGKWCSEAAWMADPSPRRL